MLKVVALVLGGSVVISLANVVVSPILHILGKSEVDSMFTGASMVAMLCLMLIGIFAVIHGLWGFCGMGDMNGIFKDFYAPNSLTNIFGK